MGYLDNSSITVDAILTKKGRELLARGRDEFQITHFALADDEVDYDLYNTEHPLGTAYYGASIENMPIVEALADETQMMKYKLVTLPKGSARIPVVRVSQTSISLESGEATIVSPNTVNFQGGNRQFGYTAILSDSDVASIRATKSARGTASVPQFIGDSEAAQSITVTGFEFEVVAKEQLLSDKTATLLIIGNETGGRVSLTITANKLQVATTAAAPTVQGS
tara:strand:- start:470 stop:1138 length:669 start_codon:yes stop_codon:yes gene_type:complete